MNKWYGKVAVVTGASSGIGAETCRQLTSRGMTVVGFARRIDKLEALRNELHGLPGKFYPVKVDVCSEESILEGFAWAKTTLKSVDVLVNNAGVCLTGELLGNSDEWKVMFDTNVLGPSICSREAVKIMQELKTIGHIININSDSGHYPPTLTPNLYVYGATKFSSVSITESLRELLALKKLPIRVTSISPGLVDTAMAKDLAENAPILKPSDVVDAIIYVLAAPQSVNVAEVIIRPTGDTYLPFVQDGLKFI
ncbi:dehydrogenase/reductase SDR family member 11-like [Sipha flava]|uniref:Dehydrogenase/reductase SDR family member 11 n=1 Tax=Sipha flava TaxID=143950 RepID=A0A2S2QXP2_9HEMI|nr:dehydrogenase/reductase SDR family member 11-like [Sipha flava]